jgi:putative tryptophan/tyrosine transport system substrate-binding protein
MSESGTNGHAAVIALCPFLAGSNMNSFCEALHKLGWVEGATIVIDRKETGTRLDSLPALAADFVQSKPDLIVTASPQPVRAVRNATSEIPIVPHRRL